jgi:hypothetical protein
MASTRRWTASTPGRWARLVWTPPTSPCPDPGDLPLTRGAKNALHRTLRIAIDLGHRQISSDHLLAGLTVGGPKDPAVRLLRACSVEPAELESAVRRRLRPQAS